MTDEQKTKPAVARSRSNVGLGIRPILINTPVEYDGCQQLSTAFDAGIEAMLPYITYLDNEIARLSKIEEAASRIAQQTNAERAYSLHDDLIVALEVPNVEVQGASRALSRSSPGTQG